MDVANAVDGRSIENNERYIQQGNLLKQLSDAAIWLRAEMVEIINKNSQQIQETQRQIEQKIENKRLE